MAAATRSGRSYPGRMTGQEPPVRQAELNALISSLTALSFRGTLAGQRQLVDEMTPAIAALKQAAEHMGQG